MKKGFAKVAKVAALPLLIILLIGVPALAAVFFAPLTITETSGTAYSMLPVIADAPVTWLVNNGYIDADGLDTRVLTTGAVARPHMVSDAKVLTVVPVPADSQTNLRFTTGQSSLSSLDIITGYDGYITITDDDTLDGGAGGTNNFEFEQAGYIDTDFDASNIKHLVEKEDAYVSYVSADEEITSAMAAAETIDQLLQTGGGLISGATWNGQTFTTDGFLTVESVDVGIGVSGAGGDTVTLGVRAVDSATGKPTGANLTSDTAVEAAAFLNFNVTDYLLSPGTQYALVLSCDGDGCTVEFQNADVYSGGVRCTSADAGVTWTLVPANDVRFRVNGTGFSATTVTDTGITVGEHTVVTRADGTCLELLIDKENLLWNTDFEVGDPPADWSVVGAGGVIARSAAQAQTGTYSISVQRNGANCRAEQSVSTFADYAGEDIILGCWAYATVAARARLQIGDGTGSSLSSFHSGGSSWEWLTVTYTMGNAPTYLRARLYILDGDTTAYFDGAVMLEGTSIPAEYISNPPVTDTLGGASIPDTAHDWKLNQNNAMPYMDYYKHTESGVEHAWYQPDDIIVDTIYNGTETAGGSAVTVTDNTMTDAPGYWTDALVTITEAGGAAPEGETSICTVFAAGGVITVSPAFSANVDIGDDFTIEFGTLIDRSYYGVEFDAADDVIACGAAADMDITDEATLTAWVYIDSDGEGNAGSIIDRRDATPDGYKLYVTTEAGGNVAVVAILDGATDAHAISNVDVSIYAWHYIVAVYNRLGTFHWEIYEDGVLLGLSTDQAGVLPITGHTANVMNIGDNAASNRCFDGRIDEPSFYTTAWTQALVTANYNAGAGLYTPTDTTSIALQLHMEEGSGAAVADTSGEANDGTITNAVWTTGLVPRPVGNSGTNDSRITWGVNPTGIGAILSSMVSSEQPEIGAPIDEPARDILPEIETGDWFVEPAVAGSLLTNPMRPFITMVSDNTTLTELQTWRWLGIVLVLLLTVLTARLIPRHLAIACFAGGATTVALVVWTIWPLWTLVLLVLYALGGWVSERSPSL